MDQQRGTFPNWSRVFTPNSICGARFQKQGRMLYLSRNVYFYPWSFEHLFLPYDPPSCQAYTRHSFPHW